MAPSTASNPIEDSVEMVTVECPCCDRAIRIESDAADFQCDECALTASFAPDEPPLALRAAA
jgi:hypothetical protein